MQSEWENDYTKRDLGAWITIGSFDGVHLGHQAIIKNIVDESHSVSAPAIVVTFFPHPLEVLRGLKSPYYLTTPEEKEKLLTSLGVDSILTLHFDHTLENKSASEFIQLLHDQFHFSHLLIGYNFKLGVKRSGDFHSLSKLGEKFGYSVKAIKPFSKSSQPVSSSAIRELVKSGNLTAAAEMLGRPYSVEGRIVSLKIIEEDSAITTATLQVWKSKLLPKPGVYSAYVQSENQRFPCTANIISQPAAAGLSPQQIIMVNIPECDTAQFGQTIRLNFSQSIKPEKV